MPEYLKTKADFDKALTDAGGKLVVVDFTASWCGPCQFIGPKFEAMSKDFTDVLFYKVDVDENSETSEDQEISAMPTFKCYKHGRKVDEICGASEEKLKEMIKRNK